MRGGIADFFEVLICFHPLLQVGVILENTAQGWGHLGRFDWPTQTTDLSGTILFLAISTLLYAGLGVLFLLATRQQIRKHIFEA